MNIGDFVTVTVGQTSSLEEPFILPSKEEMANQLARGEGSIKARFFRCIQLLDPSCVTLILAACEAIVREVEITNPRNRPECEVLFFEKLDTFISFGWFIGFARELQATRDEKALFARWRGGASMRKKCRGKDELRILQFADDLAKAMFQAHALWLADNVVGTEDMGVDAEQ